MKKFNHLRLELKNNNNNNNKKYTTTEREREREREGENFTGRRNTSDRFLSLFPHPSLRHLSGLRERERESEEGRETLSCHYENTVCFRFLFCFPLSWQR